MRHSPPVRALLTLLTVLGLTATFAVVNSSPALAKSDFSARPFMGWSSWSVQSSTRDGYGTDWLTEANIRRAADAMAGRLKKAGYRYINIDAGWNATMDWVFGFDGNGIPDPDPTRFPRGIKPVADYVHGKGLKIGLYGAAGLEKTVYDRNSPILGTDCRAQDIAVQPLTPTNMWGGNWKIDYSRPCAQAYIDSIVARMASWGVDFIKIDGTTADNVADIEAWSRAIDRAGRTMWLTASAWPVPRAAGEGLKPHANSVRVNTDIECYCDTVSSWTSSVDDRWNDLPAWLDVVGPNYWPDLDSMPIVNNTGTGLQDGINDVERQSVMTFWSMASSPLYVGGDLANLDAKAVSILTNPEVIAVDQAGRIPSRVTGGTLQTWKKQLDDGSLAVAVYNLGDSPADITVRWADLGIVGPAKVRDLVARRDLGKSTGSWQATAIPAHGSRLVRITPKVVLPPDTAAPTAPADVRATDVTATDVTLSWSPSTDNVGVTAYDVYQDGTVKASLTDTTATMTGLNPGTSYTFEVRARDAAGNISSPSAAVPVTTTPAAPGTSYEAESGTLSGRARVASCTACSGGQKVGDLYQGGALTLGDVTVPAAGTYLLIISYIAGDPTRSVSLTVNDGPATTLSFPSTGSWDTPGDLTTTVTLRAGTNTLTFDSGTGYSPDLDRFTLSPVSSPTS
ncbi:carbohydrate-binding protein [Nonomuraea terrae]|uniref:Alpha-galactosidase n=1 Tax=Nonomuraea terrae TaxID=2530383 RepID=A0A4R4Z6P3_9ACTN|nr:fibronectin type III domain-containing protein [Nonomuraea terrae]TDD53230.1 carbohydrate-binding protein [Nonomuraea terrae]